MPGVESDLFIAGVRSFLNVLISNIEADPQFQEKTKGKNFYLTNVIRLPPSFKEKGMEDAYMRIHLSEGKVEAEVGTSPLEADLVLEGDWETWKNVISGQEELSNAVVEGKIKVVQGAEKMDFEVISLIANAIMRSTVPMDVFKLIEPS
ncbi:MAG: hypothetical protein DSO02_05920 [Hadesarchaea archaeon]|nr:MAG: hypothetical protein DSO03_04165 [Hadesarchaea archaeon]TDA32023.1 MAG: hypothetical protein DSO02_05920 [Hadesarchaea archaeon]